MDMAIEEHAYRLADFAKKPFKISNNLQVFPLLIYSISNFIIIFIIFFSFFIHQFHLISFNFTIVHFCTANLFELSQIIESNPM